MIGRRRRGPALLDNGPERVDVQRRRAVRDSLGANRWVDDGAQVLVEGVMVQPVTSAETNDLGLEAFTSYRVIGRGPWPGHMHARVWWDGREWDQVGEARQHRSGLASRHFVVIITARKAAL